MTNSDRSFSQLNAQVMNGIYATILNRTVWLVLYVLCDLLLCDPQPIVSTPRLGELRLSSDQLSYRAFYRIGFPWGFWVVAARPIFSPTSKRFEFLRNRFPSSTLRFQSVPAEHPSFRFISVRLGSFRSSSDWGGHIRLSQPVFPPAWSWFGAAT
jgi:hypothetical protein